MGMKTATFIIFLCTYCTQTMQWSLDPTSWFKSSKGCEIDLNIDLNHDHEPIFLSKKGSIYDLKLPKLVNEKGVFELAKDEDLYIACTGDRNELRGFPSQGKKAIKAKCRKENTLYLEGKDISSSELECKSKANAELKETSTACGSRLGKQIQLGFNAEGWHPLVTLCFRSDRTETLYTTHVLRGSVLQGAEVKKHQSYFVKGNRRIYTGVNPESAYKQGNQREVLKQLLGETCGNRALKQSYLSRGHLSPDADFLLGTWQELTYFYVNTAPQWQSVNAGNWLKLENLVRRFAISAKRDFSVTTGTYGVLELEDQNGVLQKIFLVPQKKLMPVPELFWKIVEDTNHNDCIVFLVHNNPFLNRTSVQGLPICKNICNDYGWQSDVKDISKGFTYCCSFADFKRTVDYAPDLQCKSVLSNL